MLDFDRFKILTFDCYGTLIDWETGILRAVRGVLDAHDVDVDDKTVLETYASLESKHETGPYFRYELVLRFVMAEMSLRLGFDATREELDCVSRSIKDWKPFPDTVEALKKLKTKYKLAVVSNIDDELFKSTAERLQVPFDWVITAQQAEAYKPSHRAFEYALWKLEHPREQILHVAQSLYHDIEPANALGISSVWVNRRKGQEGSGATREATAKPDVEVTSLKELAQLAGI